MTDKIMEQIQAIRENHTFGYGGTCACKDCVEEKCSCNGDWPCDAIQLAEKLELAVKALEKIKEHAGSHTVMGNDPARGYYGWGFVFDVSEGALAAIAEVK